MRNTLRNTFPKNDDEASKFVGFMNYETCFCRIFDFKDSLEKYYLILIHF